MKSTKYESPFQFIGSTVKELVIHNDFVTLPMDDDTEKNFDLDFKITEINEIEALLQGIVELIINIELERDEASLNLSLRLEGCFVVSMDASEDFETLLNINGASTLYSIARSIILSICSVSVGGDQISLPMINFMDFTEDNQ